VYSGWYDVIVLPTHEYKWTFKEGEVAILSFPRPSSGRCTEDGSFFYMNILYISQICLTTVLTYFCSIAAQSSRSNGKTAPSVEDAEAESGRLVGTVRRHMPIDTREPIGAIIHFYVGDSFDSSR
jgi:senataxin